MRRGTLTQDAIGAASRAADGIAAPPRRRQGIMRRAMPIPKNVTFVTFDVYGTLIDWETGIYEAFAKEAARDGVEIDRDVLIPLFHEISREIEGGSYELYAEVLRRTAIEIAKRLEWPLEPSRSGFLPDSVQRWMPFKETNTQLQKLAKKYKLGPALEHRRQAARPDPPAHPDRLRPRRDRPAGPLLQARTGPLHRVRQAHRRQARLGARRRQPLPRRGAVRQTARARDLGQPQQGDARLLPEEADGRGRATSKRRPSCSASPESRCGRIALHADVLVVTSAVLQRQLRARARARRLQSGAAGVLEVRRAPRRRRPRAFVIDSPVLPGRARRAARAARAGPLPEPSGLLATHGDWDHLLGRLAFPGARARLRARAPPSAWRRAPGQAQRELRAFDEELLIERPRPLALGSVQALPVPGRCDIGDRELELHPPQGHTAGRDGGADRRGRACWSPATTCRRSRSRRSSDGGELEAYLETLERLRAAVDARRARRPGPRRRAGRASGRSRCSRRTSPTCSALREHGARRRAARRPARAATSERCTRANVAALAERRRCASALLIVAIGAPAWIGAPSVIGSSTIVPPCGR